MGRGEGRSAHSLALKLGVDCPIIAGIYRVIHERADARAVVHEVRAPRLPELFPLPPAQEAWCAERGRRRLLLCLHMAVLCLCQLPQPANMI